MVCDAFPFVKPKNVLVNIKKYFILCSCNNHISPKILFLCTLFFIGSCELEKLFPWNKR